MKQIILSGQPGLSGDICTGKLLFFWGTYGWLLGWLWQRVAGNPVMEASVWAGAIVTGLALALTKAVV
jgi:hypothetical protein